MQGSDSERSSQPPFCLSVEAANGFPQGHALSLILSVLLLSLTPSAWAPQNGALEKNSRFQSTNTPSPPPMQALGILQGLVLQF